MLISSFVKRSSPFRQWSGRPVGAAHAGADPQRRSVPAGAAARSQGLSQVLLPGEPGGRSQNGAP